MLKPLQTTAWQINDVPAIGGTDYKKSAGNMASALATYVVFCQMGGFSIFEILMLVAGGESSWSSFKTSMHIAKSAINFGS